MEAEKQGQKYDLVPGLRRNTPILPEATAGIAP
jgi:hypothetical protein